MSTVTADLELVEAIRTTLAEAGADHERAVAQQRYMKSEIPFRGLSSPGLKAALRPLLGPWVPADRAGWEATVRALWDEAAYREERYAALAVVRHRRARDWLDPASLLLSRHLVVTGAWWDLVDVVATHPVGDALAAHRAAVTPVLRRWARDDDPWVRRTAVLSQVGRRDATDPDLLRDVIGVNVDDRSFWLRKAIGWALRDYARTDPDWVRAEVDRHGVRLSNLSRREALRHL